MSDFMPVVSPLREFPQQQQQQQQQDIFKTLTKKLNKKRNSWGVLRSALYDLSLRWQWWSIVMLNKQLPPEIFQYPKIIFEDHLSETAIPVRLTKKLLAPFQYERGAWAWLLDWILYGFGDSLVKTIDHIPIELTLYWKGVFSRDQIIKMFLEYPGDWLGHHHEIFEASKYSRSANGFFTTPIAICKLMAEMTLDEANLLDSFNDPCVGTGRLLLEASNFCLNLTGNDIDLTLVKITRINCWLYVPSAIFWIPELKKRDSKAFAMPSQIKHQPRRRNWINQRQLSCDQ